MRKSAEVLGLFGLAVLLFETWSGLYGPHRLPARVATHFDAAGNPNAWGSPSGMLLLPVVAIAVYVLLTVVACFPQSFSYGPVRVTAENRARLEAAMRNLLAWLKAEIAWLFAVVQWAFVRAAATGDGRIFPRLLPVILVVIFGTVGAHLALLVRAGRAGTGV